MMSNRTLILAASWTIAFVLAVALDATLAAYAHDSGLAHWLQTHRVFSDVVKVPGHFLFTLSVAVLLWLCRRAGWKCSVFVALSGIVCGLHVLVKWIVGRTRPYKLMDDPGLHPFVLHPFRNGLKGFIDQSNLSFPSGHACEAFALAAAIVVVWPRGKWVFIALASLVGLERIAENAHYASDVVGAAGFSMLCVAVLHRLMGGWIKLPKRKAFLIKESPIQVDSGTLVP